MCTPLPPRYLRAQAPARTICSAARAGDNGRAPLRHNLRALLLLHLPMSTSKSPPDTPVPPQAQVAGTAAFSKFMHVLQLVADADSPMNVAALMRASGYPRPTVHRIVAALTAEGLLVDNAHNNALALGPRLIQLASRSWGRSELRLAALDTLTRLRDQTGETVHLAVPSGNAMVFIEKLESPGAVRMSSGIGTTVSMHATSVGKAYLAALDEAAYHARLPLLPLPRRTAQTVSTTDALDALVREARERGWAMDDEENESGIVCFGAAIRNAQGEPIAAISVSTLLFRQQPDIASAYIAPMQKAAQEISERIAHTPAIR